jgi:hypothetical protein
MRASLVCEGTEPVHGWTLAWSFDGDQQVDRLWGVDVRQSELDMSHCNLSWNETLLPGRPITFGFAGTTTGEPTHHQSRSRSTEIPAPPAG